MSLYIDESGQRVDGISGSSNPAVVVASVSGTEANAGSARMIIATFSLNSIASAGKVTLAVRTTACRSNSTVVTNLLIWDGTPITHGIPVITLSAPTAGAAAIELSNFGANATGARVAQFCVQIL